MLIVEYWNGDEGWSHNVRVEGVGTDAVRLSFHCGLSTSKPSSEEILPRVCDLLRRSPIAWISPGRTRWRLDLSGLRADLVDYPELKWLTYTALLAPEVTIQDRHTFGFASHFPSAQFYLQPQSAQDVFVVHGHNDAAREKVARFLEQLSLRPIILHEQINKGRTIIEKFEDHADVAFAIVILTGDDLARAASSNAELKPRARQNVILELGYFVASLGRDRVCALVEAGVEIPSDFRAVMYTPLDSANGWRTQVARELQEAGIPVDMNKL